MKGKLFLLFFVVVAVVTMAFTPSPFQETEPVLTEAQLVIIGTVASVLLWVFRLMASYGFELKREVAAVVLYVISFVLAISFTALTFPPFPPFNDAPSFIGALLLYIGSLLQVASPVAGMAFLIYNILLKRVIEQWVPAVAAKIRS